MAKDNLVYIEHMIDCILRINEYVNDKDGFYHSHLIQDAVVRNLQIMSESSQRIDDTIKINYLDIAWREISGFRNILVHDYLGLDLDMIWSVIEQELPKLHSTLEIILTDLELKENNTSV
jgi:uncharacterized protein with HEPN domain